VELRFLVTKSGRLLFLPGSLLVLVGESEGFLKMLEICPKSSEICYSWVYW
jgi:hypothetical protein